MSIQSVPEKRPKYVGSCLYLVKKSWLFKPYHCLPSYPPLQTPASFRPLSSVPYFVPKVRLPHVSVIMRLYEGSAATPVISKGQKWLLG